MAEVARRLFRGHRVFGGWTARRVLAVCALAALLLLIVSRTDPRLRAGILYVRGPRALTMPVAGLPVSAVRDSWHESRSEGRRHEGVDLFAPRGMQVIAAANGRVWSLGRNSLGGNTVTVVGDGWRAYYYAHLDAWAPNLQPGDRVRAGDVLGGVGDTGDATGLPTHLHFAITQLSIFGAYPLDPAPLLRVASVRPAATLTNGVKTLPASALHSGGREDLAMP